MKKTKSLICAILSIVIALLCCNGCKKNYEIKCDNLMDNITPNKISAVSIDNQFVQHYSNFCFDIFKNSFKDKQKNALVSPLSIMLALAMTNNGADNQTKTQMESVLGGGMDINLINQYLYSYVNSLVSNKDCKLNIANSIWFRDEQDRLTVEDNFLQTNADFYNASAYKANFNDKQTVKDINNWVAKNTDGLIEKVIDQIDPYCIMYLINALIFDAKWQNSYMAYDVSTKTFYNLDNTKKDVKFMSSTENKYIKDNNAVGFAKNYLGGNYSFVALLPNENTNINDYINGLSGETFVNALSNAKKTAVEVELPKFEVDYELSLNNVLVSMGMTNAFDSILADFSKIGKSNQNIYIGNVLHKTHVILNEIGTRAGAVTVVEMKNTSAPLSPESIKIILDRPFVYSIVDNNTNLPIFIGAITNL